MNPKVVLGLAAVAVFLVLWVAYRLGRILLRILVGLLALGLLSWGLWRLLK